MTSKKAREARRQRNVALTAKDRANRCDACKRALRPGALRYETGMKFCDLDCYRDWLEAYQDRTAS
jgi:hypothetical protein